MLDEAKWYYLRDGGSMGPESVGRLLELLDDAVITRQTAVWHDGNPIWQPLEVALGLTADVPPTIPGAPNIPPPIAPSGPPLAVERSGADGGYTDYAPHPWRRYFARMFDTLVGGSAAIFVISLLLAATNQSASKAFIALLSGPENRIIGTLLTVGLAIFPNALTIGFTGSSLGKWIYGIAVTNPDGTLPGFRTALRREVMVWVRGLGLGVPIISLFTLISAFKELKTKQLTTWDDQLSLRVGQRKATATQMILNFVGVALWLGAFIGLVALDSA